MGFFDFFKKKSAALTKDQEYILEMITTKVNMGFDPPEAIKQMAKDILADEHLEDSVTEAWINAVVDQKVTLQLQESKSWDSPTDPDKLALAFNDLSRSKIIALHLAGYTNSEGERDIIEIEQNLRTKGIKSDGYCFYHEQDLQRAVDPQQRNLMIAFQKVDNSDDYVTIAIGLIVSDKLRKYGFKVNWNESVSQKIEIEDINWQKVYQPEAGEFSHQRVIKLMTRSY